MTQVETDNPSQAAPACPRCKMDIVADAEFCEHCGAKVGQHKQVPFWHVHRRAYDWTLAWAYRPSAAIALMVLSFAESSFFPIPPDVLLMPLVLGARRRWLRYATICSASSVARAFLGYVIGMFLIDVALMIPHITQEAIDSLAGKFNENGQAYVFLAALTPIPFKLLTITAGFAKMHLLLFAAACAVGRSIRFFTVAWLMHRFGPTITPFLDKYFNWLAMLFGALLVGGFIVVKYIF